MSFMAFLNMLLREHDPDYKDTHKHRCGYTPRGEEPKGEVGGCGLVIEHDRPPTGTSSEDYAVHHTCANCGRINYWRYHGRVPVGQKRLKPEAAT